MNAAAPDALPDAASPTLVLPSRVAPAGAGWDWIAGGWRLFLRAPLMWIITMVLLFIVFVALGLVPIIGSLVAQVLQPVVGAGLIVACHSLHQGGDFEIEHLLAGFRRNFGKLATLGALFVVGGILILLVFLAFVGFSVAGAFMTGDPDQMLAAITASALTILLGLLVMLALLVPLFAAMWFAPALVIMHDLDVVAAMRESFFACLRNFVPFLVYGIVLLLLGILAAIPFLLGYLVLFPVVMASIYVSYRQVFTEEAPPPAAPSFR